MSLEDLPEDIISEIACWLNDAAINSLIRTSKRFDNILSTPKTFHWVKRVSDLTGVKFEYANKYTYKCVKFSKPDELLTWAALNNHTEYLKLILKTAKYHRVIEALEWTRMPLDSFKIIIKHAQRFRYNIYRLGYTVLHALVYADDSTRVEFLLKEIPPPQVILNDLYAIAKRIRGQSCIDVLARAGANA